MLSFYSADSFFFFFLNMTEILSTDSHGLLAFSIIIIFKATQRSFTVSKVIIEKDVTHAHIKTRTNTHMPTYESI